MIRAHLSCSVCDATCEELVVDDNIPPSALRGDDTVQPINHDEMDSHMMLDSPVGGIIFNNLSPARLEAKSNRVERTNIFVWKWTAPQERAPLAKAYHDIHYGSSKLCIR